MKKIILIIAYIFLSNSFNSFAQISSIKTVVTLTGSVLSDVNHKPVSCEIEAYDESGKRVYKGKSNAAENGYYFITGLKPGEKYSINFVDMNYLRMKQVVELPVTDKYTEFSHDFLVIPKVIGSEIKLHIPPFELNKGRLRYGIEDYLNTFKEIVKMNVKLNLDVVCYPDNDENESENQKLTEERGKSLKAFLIAAGVDPLKINIKSMSKTDPKNPPPIKKQAKGKRYIGTSYLIVTAC